MPAIQFPENPSPGQVFTASDRRWTYDDAKGAWVGGYGAVTPASIGAAPATGIAPSAIVGTAVVDSDPRLSDARAPTTHNHNGVHAPATGIAPSAIAGTAVVTGDPRLVSFINATLTQLTGTGATSLAALVTVGSALDRVVGVVVSGALAFYQLKSGTSATALPGIVRPNDYNASTNTRFWQQIL